MTNKAISNLFKEDSMPVCAVGISDNGRIIIVADVYAKYLPRMPKGKRNVGYEGTGIFELEDNGSLRDLKLFRSSIRAKADFLDLAESEGLQVAYNSRGLKSLLKGRELQ